MPQVSRPLLIALVVVVGLAGVWMTVLRPRAQSGEGAGAAPAATGAAAPGPTAPGMAGLGRAVDKAHGAVAASDASAAKAEQAANGQPGEAPSAPAQSSPPVTPAPASAPAAPAEQTAPATAAAPVRPARASRATVLLIAGDGADDVAARAVVRSLRRPGVRTIIASVKDLGRYEALIGDVRIEALPTILVVGADHKAQRIVGLPDRAQVEQALDAAG